MADQIAVEKLESCIEFLADPSRFYVAAEEVIEVSDDEIEREVSATLQFSKLKSDTSSVFIVTLRPNKGSPVEVELNKVDGFDLPRRLTHDEHLRVCSQLITRRYLQVVKSGDAYSGEVVSDYEVIKTLSRLRSIPYLEPSSAAEILEQEFTEKKFLRIFENKVHVSNEYLHSLYSLCTILANRYFIMFEADSTNSRVQLSYRYRQSYQDKVVSWRGKFRRATSANPYDLRIHIPLARCAPHYTISVKCIPGFYFDEQRVLTDPSGTDSVTRSWLHGSESAVNVSESVSVAREVGRATRSFIHIDNGFDEKKRLYAGYRLWERPPGITARYLLNCSLMLFLSIIMIGWMFSVKVTPLVGAATSLIVGLASFVSILRSGIMPDETLVTNALKPRFMMTIAIASNFFFALWMLQHGTTPRNDYVLLNQNWLDLPIRWIATRYAGIHLAIMLVLVAVLGRRLVRLNRRYAIVVGEN